jgi:pimeloyl-ACP methyl ester carboxylesterase
MDNVILSATTMVYSKFRHLQQYLDEIREKKVPILMVLSENDKLVDTHISYEMANILGAQEDSYSVYNQYSVIEKERRSQNFPWIVVLPEGGHYSFVNHPKVVNGEIMRFLQKLNSSDQSSSTCHSRSSSSLECEQETQPKILYPDVNSLPVSVSV